jgi:gliding motility-associated-like protein
MRITILICLVFYSCSAFCQKQNNNWCFGTNAGLNFNTSSPTSFVSNISTFETGACVSDRHTGSLLFYTDGVHVWGKNGMQMPNGDSIGTDISFTSSQGALIIPYPGDTNKYYIFTLEHYQTATGLLRYSVVDITLNSGNGDIVPSQKNIVIDSNLTEGMTSKNACGYYWLIAMKRVSNDFVAYKIDSAGGISLPVVSPKNYIRGSNGISNIRLSKSGTLLGVTAFNGVGAISYVALHNFNINTGRVTNGKVIDSAIGTNQFYGCEFSPDESRLYVIAYVLRNVYQYNLAVKTVPAINSSRKLLYYSPGLIGALQIAPDSNIYIPFMGTQSLGRISNCDALFPNCVFTPNAVTLAAGTGAAVALPQPVHFSDEGIIIPGTHIDTIACNVNAAVLHARGVHQSYQWQDNSTADTFAIASSGVYWVKMTDSCVEHTDTFVALINPAMSLELGNDTLICPGRSVVLRNKYVNTITMQYIWNTGSTDTAITVSDTGRYILTLSKDICIASDTIRIGRKPTHNVYIGKDTSICENTNIVLRCNSQPAGTQYYWSNGSTADNITTNGEGLYTLYTDNEGCSATDSIWITNLRLPIVDLGNDTSICFPDYISIPRAVIKGTGYSFLWSDGRTDSARVIDNEGRYKLRLTNICGVAEDSIEVQAGNCSIWFPKAFSPNGDGRNDVAHLIGDISNVSRFRIIIYNRWGQNVYTSDDVWQGWDGSFKGKQAESGTYYYMINLIYKSKEQRWKGDVTIVR